MWQFANNHEVVTLLIVIIFMFFVYKMFKSFVDRNKPSSKCINYETHDDLSDREEE